MLTGHSPETIVRHLPPWALATVLAFLLPGRLAAQQQVPFLDAHVHLNDPAAWVRLMDDHAIPWSVAFRGRNIDHRDLAAAAARWPDRITPFASISPEHREYRQAWADGDTTILGELDSLLATGRFAGIGEISVSHFAGAGFPEADFDPSGTIMRGIMALARRHGVPVSIHCEITRLREFEMLLESFPDVTVIWAHGGYTPLVLAARMLERHPNLVYELSARTWVVHPRSPDYTVLRDGRAAWPQWLELVEAMPDRFIVGTDASLRSQASDLEKIRSVQGFLAQLTPATRELVARENLKRLVGR